MRITTLLTPELSAKLEYAVSSLHELRVATLPALFESKAEPEIDVLVVEPRCVTKDPHTISRLIAFASASKIAVYTRLEPKELRTLLELVRSGVRHIIFFELTDSSVALLGLIESVRSDALTDRFLVRIEPNLSRLPQTFGSLIVDAVRRPYEYSNVAAVCGLAGVPRRSCDRWFSQAGLVSISRLITAARVLRSIGPIRDGRRAIAAIARDVGAVSARQLSFDVRRVVGQTPSSVRRLRDEPILNAVMAYVCDTRIVDPVSSGPPT